MVRPTDPVPAAPAIQRTTMGVGELDAGRDVDDQVERGHGSRHLGERVVRGQGAAVPDRAVEQPRTVAQDVAQGVDEQARRRTPRVPGRRRASEAPSTATSAAAPSGSSPAADHAAPGGRYRDVPETGGAQVEVRREQLIVLGRQRRRRDGRPSSRSASSQPGSSASEEAARAASSDTNPRDRGGTLTRANPPSPA